MPDGSIVISTALDNKELERDLSRLKRKVEGLEEKLFKQKQGRLPIADQARDLGAALDAAKAKLDSMQSGDKFFTKASVAGQAEEVKRLQTEYSAVDRVLERCDTRIKATNVDLDLQKTKAGGVTQQLAAAGSASNLMGGAIKRAGKSLDLFKSRLASVVRSALIFTVITQSLAKLRNWMGKVVKSNAEASAAVARLKGALLTLAQPLVDVVIPAFTAFVDALARVISVLAHLMSMLFHTTAQQSAQAAEALNKETAALDGTGAAAKKAANQLAGFDEINKLSDDSDSGGGGSAPIKPDFSLFNTAEYKNKIDEIAVYMSGALLALGAILAFSGINIPLGIGLMAVGAVGLAAEIAANWGAMDGGLKTAINTVLLTLGTAGLVIGAILAFSGANLPLGIGLMVAGAASIGTAIALNWDSMDKSMQDAISGLLTVLGISLLAIGAVFAFSGANLPLGIGLMIAGAASLAGVVALNWNVLKDDVGGVATELLVMLGTALLAIGAVLAFSGANLLLGIGLMVAGAASLGAAAALNWDSIVTALKGPMGQVVAIASGALLALGVIIALSGAALPLGIGLIAAGAAGLATVATLNWDSIVTALRGPVGETVALASGALLALGIILALSGVGLPLGIALIAAGAAGLVTVTALNWDTILEKLKGVWSKITSWWNQSVAPKFTLEYWKGVFGSIKDGLVSKIKDAVNGGISLFNRFIDWINKKLNISWGSFSLFGKEIIPSGSFQLLTLPHIPMLAQGAVIPPNREFMAVLGDQRHGTNIEAPEDLIRKIVHDESGNSAVVAELREILAAIREGKVMMVDRRELGRVTREELANASRSGGYTSIPVR